MAVDTYKSQREWAKKNPDKIKVIRKRYEEKNKEKLSLKNKEYYKNNKERLNKDRGKRRRERAKWYASLKEGKLCSDCGLSFHPAAMDWHHVNGDGLSSKTAMTRLGKKRLFEEIEKCILLCANCHRIRSYETKIAGIYSN